MGRVGQVRPCLPDPTSPTCPTCHNSPSMPLSQGTRLGPYELLGKLGAGGMGEVYRARDTRLDRTVAIKVLTHDAAADQSFRERFEREAKAIAAFNHPHICTLHDVGEDAGTSFLVMEHLEGETLAARIARGPLTPAEALPIAGQIAAALDRAHRAGIVHRDLKPANVMLVKGPMRAGATSSTVTAKLLDFGLARVGSALSGIGLDAANSPTLASGLTVQGTILGTLHYMSPEQIDGEEADARSDIFAFGVVLYEMLTGTRAFEGKTPASVFGSILRDQPPPVSALQPLATPALDQLVRTCLAKDRDDRVQSAHDVRLQLQWIAENPSTLMPQAVGHRRCTLTIAPSSSAAMGDCRCDFSCRGGCDCLAPRSHARVNRRGSRSHRRRGPNGSRRTA